MLRSATELYRHQSAAGNRTRGDWVKTRHVTYYTTADTREEGENRTREPEGLGPEPSAFDRFATSPPKQEIFVPKGRKPQRILFLPNKAPWQDRIADLFITSEPLCH